MDYTQILIKPLVSEKATFVREAANQVAFYVHVKANKIEIAKAVEEAFKVSVVDVNVITVKNRARYRQGRIQGKEAGYRKAYVTLKEGETIEFFEGV